MAKAIIPQPPGYVSPETKRIVEAMQRLPFFRMSVTAYDKRRSL